MVRKPEYEVVWPITGRESLDVLVPPDPQRWRLWQVRGSLITDDAPGYTGYPSRAETHPTRKRTRPARRVVPCRGCQAPLSRRRVGSGYVRCVRCVATRKRSAT